MNRFKKDIRCFYIDGDSLDYFITDDPYRAYTNLGDNDYFYHRRDFVMPEIHGHRDIISAYLSYPYVSEVLLDEIYYIIRKEWERKKYVLL